MSERTIAQKNQPFQPATNRTNGILQRKCACGNHIPAGGKCTECTKKKRMLQRKLTIGASNDPLEQEADRVADQVWSVPVNSDSSIAPRIQRLTELASSETDTAPSSVDRVLVSSGKPLEPALQQDMEQRFGCDFSHVRVHSDAAAEQSAREVNASAYTAGHDIVFGTGRFAPATSEGRRLIAHELTHVVQQLGSERSGIDQSNGKHNLSPAIQRQAVTSAPVPLSSTGGLSEEMLQQIARALHEAMAGLGTDEEAIFSAFAGRTQAQADSIARVYQTMFGVVLLDELKDELSESELMHLAIFNPLAVPGQSGSIGQTMTFADMIAAQLDKAMDRWGTDEDSIYAALAGRSQAELQAIKEAYKRRTNRELEVDIRDEMSGSELARALALLNQGVLFPEDEAYFAMKGAGTDEEALFRVLETVKGDRAKVIDLIDRFAKKYGNLLEWVNDELSGTDLDKALEALLGETPSGLCSVSQRGVALEAISLAAAMAQAAVTKANTDLVSNKLSGEVKNALSTYFNPGNAPNAVNLGLLRQVRDVLNATRIDILSFSEVACVTQNDGHCVTKPDCSSSFVGAWTSTSRGATVRICPGFFSCENDQARNLLHEFVHHMGMRDREIYYGQPGYSSLTPIGDGSVNDSLEKADPYAHFAQELF